MGLEKAETRLFINNEFVPGKANKTFKLFNPATEEEICSVHEASAEDVDAAVDAAQAAFLAWSELSAHERAAPMAKLSQLILRDAEALAELDAAAMGKSMDIPACAGVFNYFAGSGYHVLGESSLNTAQTLNISVRQPYGVCGLIIPWNVPLIMFAFKVAPALICGNTVVLKTSEKAPLSSLKVASLIKEAGFPPGVVNIVNGFGEPTGSAIALHMKIRKISFTGSVATGKKIMKMSAESNLKNVSLELGGKSPAIVFEDADIAAAAKYTHFSINHNSGQHCQANSRVLVHESVVNDYLKELQTLMSLVTLGDPTEASTFQGPQADQRQMENILRLADIGKKDGQLIRGGKRFGEKGFFVEPTILVNVPQDSDAYKEEIFGPVVIVNTFKDEAEALAEANATEFGLFSSVYTKDFERAVRVSKRLESGAVGINCSVPLRALDMPIGGWKQSGVGRELALHGLNLYTELKTIFMKYGQPPSLANHWHNSL
ncbi:aldehyde dehydrogenase [Thozetella sp. PMI_491]|nr:aldehyde dehydrogenase [Thozetella sp. PMI_491]